jgi:hypothetical protein
MRSNERLKWLTLRLQTMSPGEVLWRLSEMVGHMRLRTRLEGIRRQASRRSAYPCPLFHAPEFNGQVERTSEEIRRRILKNADQWLRHRANLFALHDVSLGDSIEWHRDYSSGVIGPLRYSGLINHRDPAIAGRGM